MNSKFRAPHNLANVLAAAPEMLAALKDAIKLSDKKVSPIGRTRECQAVYDKCAAAVAKAEGRS